MTSFNPDNIQLQREADEVNRNMFFQFKRNQSLIGEI